MKNEESNPNPYTTRLLKLEGSNILSFDETTKRPFDMNEFIIEEPLVSTSNSVVKRYRHKHIEKIVVIKQIVISRSRLDDNQDKINHLKKEIKFLQLLKGSKNVVEIYGFGIDPEHLYICLESMDISLKDLYLLVHRLYGNFPEELMSKIIINIVDALCECHKNSITHRDVKPQNILVNWDGNIKLCDFGVSRILYETSAYTTTGTCPYMPPEYFTNGRYGLKVDVWSLGITISEVLRGKNLISGECTFPEIVQFIRDLNPHELVESLPKIYSDELKEFIKECLTMKYEDRPTLEVLKNLNLYKNEQEGGSNSFKSVIITRILHNSRLLFEKQIKEADPIHNTKIIDDLRKDQNLVVGDQNLVVEDQNLVVGDQNLVVEEEGHTFEDSLNHEAIENGFNATAATTHQDNGSSEVNEERQEDRNEGSTGVLNRARHIKPRFLMSRPGPGPKNRVNGPAFGPFRFKK